MPPRDKKTTGYRYEPTVETRRLEALKLMFELADLKLTFTDISARLWAQNLGHYTKPFGYHGIESILSNSAYIGLPAWGIFLQPAGFILFFAAAFAETKKARS